MSVHTTVVDLALGEIGDSSDPEGSLVPALGTKKQFSKGKIGRLIRASGAIPDGSFCGMRAGGDAIALTDTLLVAMSASEREALILGFFQGGGSDAADNEFGWILEEKPLDTDTDGGFLQAGDIAANAQVATTDTAGRVDDAAAAGSYDIIGMQVETATTGGAGSKETTAWWSNLRLNPTAN